LQIGQMRFRFGTTTITVNTPDSTTLLSEVSARLRAHTGFALATINLDHLVKLRRSEAFRAAYAAQDFVVADGNPIVWLSRLARQPVSLVPGSDMVLPLARAAAKAKVAVALVGATETTLAAAAANLTAAVPGLQVSYCCAPSMGFDPEGTEAAEILRNLASKKIGLCFLALGAPRQECLAARGRRLAPDVGFACLGAGLDFLSGAQSRAPIWVRQIAMEWLWRAMSSPRRLIPRYAACAAILPGQIAEALKQR
jgi:N-acetylglucosaminyldiphosphoundecaprenol N-acetyl-beta-D-mannosaminyltransferase